MGLAVRPSKLKACTSEESFKVVHMRLTQRRRATRSPRTSREMAVQILEDEADDPLAAWNRGLRTRTAGDAQAVRSMRPI